MTQLDILGVLFGVLAAISGLLMGASFTRVDHEKYPKLTKLDGKKVHLFISTFVFLILAAVTQIIQVTTKPSLEQTQGPGGQIFEKATLTGIEKEVEEALLDQRSQTTAHFKAGERDFLARRYREAASNYQKSIRFIPTMFAYLNLGISLWYMSRFALAEEAFISGLKIAQQQGNKEFEASFLGNLGSTYHFQGKQDEALKAVEKVRNIILELGSAKSLERVEEMIEEFRIPAFAEKKNPTLYPYAGEVDSLWVIIVPASGIQQASDNDVDRFIRFHDPVNFMSVHFDTFADFRSAKFDSIAYFRDTRFKSEAAFGFAFFYGDAIFWRAQFDTTADFGYALFNSMADFAGVQCKDHVDFSSARFDVVDFSSAQFNTFVDFTKAEFKNQVDFRYAHLDSSSFEQSIIYDKFILGSPDGQNFDFTRTIFTPNTTLELHGLVDLDMQLEKIKYVSVLETLSYFSKKDILENLKNSSFEDDKKAQFELDYLFAKSTIYQDQADTYKANKMYQIWKWPKWFLSTLYYLTMGLGYRPFRLGYWILGLIALFTGIYWKKFSEKINDYIQTNFSSIDSQDKLLDKSNKFSTFLNCAYFSSMVLFTFRLKGNILTFFDDSQKKIIVTQWTIGFAIYIAFLTLAKSGSIVHTLKSLFVG